MSNLMSNIMFFSGLTIVTLILGFGCFLIYDAEKREAKEREHNRKNRSKRKSR